MEWWHWALGAVIAVLLWVRVRRGRRAAESNLVAGSSRDMLGRGGF